MQLFLLCVLSYLFHVSYLSYKNSIVKLLQIILCALLVQSLSGWLRPVKLKKDKKETLILDKHE